ncbi:jg15737 [Pararge aegeria aegeria]|uniref:Jg15737 protein n=1 Tax=Pararge aegeria aegeria TaxID=348720 RepID=A0A8S4RIN9_9NEOP|nr:jg15737 [Pararge aegeria aegeria]
MWSPPIRTGLAWWTTALTPSHCGRRPVPCSWQAPVPVSSWEGTRDATNVSPVCVQRNPYTRQNEIVGQEDCLYLNVYSPYTDDKPVEEKDLLPVMVFIHGGGWMCGDATTEMYGPEHLLDRDVIFVAMNYRLGMEATLINRTLFDIQHRQFY